MSVEILGSCLFVLHWIGHLSAYSNYPHYLYTLLPLVTDTRGSRLGTTISTLSCSNLLFSFLLLLFLFFFLWPHHAECGLFVPWQGMEPSPLHWRHGVLTIRPFNLHAQYIMQNAGLAESQAGIKIARRNINNLRYADDTTLMEEGEEELKRLLMRVKEESEKTTWNSTFKKLRSWHLVLSLHGK